MGTHMLYMVNVHVRILSNHHVFCTFGYIRLQFLLMFQLTTCVVCQRMNRKLTNGIPEMHSISVKAMNLFTQQFNIIFQHYVSHHIHLEAQNHVTNLFNMTCSFVDTLHKDMNTLFHDT